MIWINNREKKKVAENINHVMLILSDQETLQLVLA